jgi:hypothetical protein
MFKSFKPFKQFNPLLRPPPRRGGGKHVLSIVEGRWGFKRLELFERLERTESLSDLNPRVGVFDAG